MAIEPNPERLNFGIPWIPGIVAVAIIASVLKN
jgi:hypothetical protein